MFSHSYFFYLPYWIGPITNSVPVGLVSVFRDLVANQEGMRG